MDGKFRPSEQNLNEILSKKTQYIVPKFQREYSWVSDRVQTFWDDLIQNHDKVEKSDTDFDNEYYFGAMVFIKNRDQKDIILVDGQQRFATVTTFLCVVRDVLSQFQDSTVDNTVKVTASAVEQTILNFIQETKDDNEFLFWKLQLNVRNNEFFRKYIQTYSLPEQKISEMKLVKRKTTSQKNLENAYVLLHEKILDFQSKYSVDEQPNKLRSLCLRMLNWFSVITISVENEEDAFDIFESLNERGEPLIIGDLVKNMLMKKSSDNESLDNNWGVIMNNLKGESKRIDQFLTFSWYSRRFWNDKKISKKNLFKTIKLNLSTETKVLDYVSSLLDDSENYDFLTHPEDHISYWGDEDIIHYLSSLQLLGAERTLPCLMAGFRKFGHDKNKYKEFVRSILSFFFRYKTFESNSADGVLKNMVNLASYISGFDPTPKDGPIECVPWGINEIKKYLNDLVSSDEKFQDEFAKWTTDSSIISKYVLYELEFLYAGERNRELKPIKNLTWEHILPQKYDEFWSDFPNAESYVNRLGNMTILSNFDNSKIKNCKYDDKKSKAYDPSFLQINKKTVCNENKWTLEIINARQKKFAQKAIEIWKF
jgi:uncharacterized protein with ParB-like and HNH nuclease domain